MLERRDDVFLMKTQLLFWMRIGVLSILGVMYCGAAMGAGEPNWIGQANNAFALDLYAKLAAQSDGNLFLSPNSLETALTMTYAGARGNTATEMAAVLHLPADSNAIPKDFGDFIKELNGGSTAAGGKGRAYQLSVANALWGQTGFHFLPDFTDMLKTDYEAGLQEVNFKKDSEGATKTINAWVEKETHDKIMDLIRPGVLTTATRLVLTNAIYFKGNWAAKFEQSGTKDEPFHLSANQQTNVPMMHRIDEYGYAAGEGYHALKLEYAGRELSMIILLPNDVNGLPQLETKLAAELPGLAAKFVSQKVDVSMPKFRMTQGMELGPVLISMGMGDAFGGNADFSGMTGGKDFAISNVIHKAFVDVNEEGTEAAAATAVVMRTLAIARPIPPPVFRADHPFIFLIQDEKSGAILFLGRVVKPAP
jgi:serpin B